MAYTKKVDTNIKENEKNVVDSIDITNLEKENMQLKEKMLEIEKQMNQLLSALNNQSNIESSNEDRDIEVISLTNAQMILSTTGKADGKKYEFEKQYTIKYIPESDLKLIINSMPRITQGGSYYINDKEFVQKNRLTGLYKNILDPTVMKNILDKNHKEFIAIYESAPLGQKTIINSMVFDKRLNGENVDANILMYLQNKTNIDYINIEPLLKEG
jgi:hypothetical protein